MKRVFYLFTALAIVAAALSGCGRQGVTGITKEQAAKIAEEHLRRYGHYPPVVERVEVEGGEGEPYWKRFGQPPIESPPKRHCWIVRFYYPGPCEGSHLPSTWTGKAVRSLVAPRPSSSIKRFPALQNPRQPS